MVKYEAEVVGGAVVVVPGLKDFDEDCTVFDDVVGVDFALFRNKRFVLNENSKLLEMKSEKIFYLGLLFPKLMNMANFEVFC